MSLSTKSILVDLNIRKWEGRKKDRLAAESIRNAHSADLGAIGAHKKLLPGSKELQKILNHAAAMRTFFNSQSLPWLADGTRIMPSILFWEYSQKYQSQKLQFENLVADFLAVYPILRDHAKISLGSLYNANEYPDEIALKKRFQCEIAVMPLPDVKDFRVDIGDAERDSFEKKMREIESKAMREVWERLHCVINHAVKQFSNPDARLHESILGNISELCALLPKLNIADDIKLEKSRADVESAIAKIKLDVLKENPTERQSAANALDDIMKKMGPIMGRI